MLTAEIDPSDLVEVTFRAGGKAHKVIAFSVSFVPVVHKGRRLIAAEILHDPGNQSPTASYLAPQYERTLVWPRAIVRVRPFLA